MIFIYNQIIHPCVILILLLFLILLLSRTDSKLTGPLFIRSRPNPGSFLNPHVPQNTTPTISARPFTRPADGLNLSLTSPESILSQPVPIHALGRRCATHTTCHVAVFSAVYKEDVYLYEWIVWHLLHGVDHFFLCDMRPRTYRTAALLSPFMRFGQVTLVHRHALWQYGEARLIEQIDGIRMLLEVYGNRTEWALVLDPDEFWVSEVYGSIPAMIAAHEAGKVDVEGGNLLDQKNKRLKAADMPADIIRIPWYVFGSSGHIQRPGRRITVGNSSQVMDSNSSLDIINTIGSYTLRTDHMVYDVERYIWRRHNGKVLFRTACFHHIPHPHDILIAQYKYVFASAADHYLAHYKHRIINSCMNVLSEDIPQKISNWTICPNISFSSNIYNKSFPNNHWSLRTLHLHSSLSNNITIPGANGAAKWALLAGRGTDPPLVLRRCRPGHRPTQPTHDPGFHINHYHLKSYTDFYTKRHATGFTGIRSDTLTPRVGRGYWNSQARDFRREWRYHDLLWCCTNDTRLVRAGGVLVRRVLEVPPPPAALEYDSLVDPEVVAVRTHGLAPAVPGDEPMAVQDRDVALPPRISGLEGL